VIVGVHGAVAGDVDRETVALEQGVKRDVFNPGDEVVETRGVVDVGKGDVEDVEESVGVHSTVVNDLGDVGIFEEEFEPDNHGVGGVFV